MPTRTPLIPAAMHTLVERAGYLPALKVGRTLYCAGQVGRDEALAVIDDPERQFVAAWENLRQVLAEGGCGFDEVVDLTTYHVGLRQHMAVFRAVKDRLFPRASCPWTCIGVAELAHPGLLVEIKCVAVAR